MLSSCGQREARKSAGQLLGLEYFKHRKQSLDNTKPKPSCPQLQFGSLLKDLTCHSGHLPFTFPFLQNVCAFRGLHQNPTSTFPGVPASNLETLAGGRRTLSSLKVSPNLAQLANLRLKQRLFRFESMGKSKPQPRGFGRWERTRQAGLFGWPGGGHEVIWNKIAACRAEIMTSSTGVPWGPLIAFFAFGTLVGPGQMKLSQLAGDATCSRTQEFKQRAIEGLS